MARDWGGFRAASWSQPPLSLFRTPSTEAPNCHSNPNASALSSPFSGSRLILDCHLSSLLGYQMPTCTWRPANSNNMKRGSFMHCWIRFNNWDTSFINVVEINLLYKLGFINDNQHNLQWQCVLKESIHAPQASESILTDVTSFKSTTLLHSDVNSSSLPLWIFLHESCNCDLGMTIAVVRWILTTQDLLMTECQGGSPKASVVKGVPLRDIYQVTFGMPKSLWGTKTFDDKKCMNATRKINKKRVNQ